MRNSWTMVSAAFGLVIAFSVWRNGSTLIVSAGAGLLATGIFYLISRFVIRE